MSTISKAVLDIVLKRLSCGLDLDNVSIGDATNKSIRVAYMTFCASKQGVPLSDDYLLKAACRLENYEATESVMAKLKSVLMWMRANIPNVKPNPMFQTHWTTWTKDTEKKYAKRLISQIKPVLVAKKKREGEKNRINKKIADGLLPDEQKLLDALECRDYETVSQQPLGYLVDVALERIRLHQQYPNVYPLWLSRTIFRQIYKKEPTPEEDRRTTSLLKEIEAHFQDKDIPKSNISEADRLHIDEAVSDWAGLTQKERNKIIAKKSAEKINRAKGMLPIEERKAIRAAQRDATEQERKLSSAAKEKYKETHPFCVCHKIRISPNRKQQTYLLKCFGTTRFVYNWLVDEWERLRSEGERPTAIDVSKRFNAIAQTEYPWTYKVTHYAKATAFRAFENAFDRFIKNGDRPQPKKHGLNAGSLHYVKGDRKQPMLLDSNPDLPNATPSQKRQYLHVPGLGYVKTMERLRFEGLLTSVIVKRESDGRYYAVLRVYVDHEEWQRTHKRKYDVQTFDEPVGIDLGVSSLAILSNGLRIDSPQKNERLSAQKKQLQKAIAVRKEKHSRHTSKKQKRMARQLAVVKAKICRKRDDYHHKVTSVLAYTYKNVSMENLNVIDMIRDGKIPPHLILESALYHFRILMEQKMMMAGHHLYLAEKGYPSSEICSRCGHQIEKIPLSKRTFCCPECGYKIDRDLNAAVNLRKLIGLDKSETNPADKGVLTTILTRNGIGTHQTREVEQAGHVT
jgi:putative transposase